MRFIGDLRVVLFLFLVDFFVLGLANSENTLVYLLLGVSLIFSLEVSYLFIDTSYALSEVYLYLIYDSAILEES